MTASPVRVVVTGLSWMGSGIGSVDSALEILIKGARQEIQVVAYAISTNAYRILDLLEERLQAGVVVAMVVNRLEKQPARVASRLIAFNRAYKHFKLYDFRPGDPEEDLHAKFLVADRTTVLIGSANLSGRGLAGNHELAIVVEGRAAADTAAAVDKLVLNPAAVLVSKAP